MSSQELSVIIPCKNERMNIRPCIESAQAVADEILVADSGSTDGTLDIVEQIGGCRVIEREYAYPADFKNWAIPQARHEWVLIVDADERVTPALAAEIRQVLASPPDEIDGYWIGRRNHYLGYHIRHCGWNTDDVLRLFRRDVARYEDRMVHEEIQLAPNRVRRLTTSFDHFTAWDSDSILFKTIRYANWGAIDMRRRRPKRDPGWLALLLRGPVRFLQLYVLRLGFLDGIPGLQVCMLTAFSSYLKQAKLWEIHHAIQQPDPEAAHEARQGDGGSTLDVINFPHTPRRSAAEAGHVARKAA